MKRTGVAKPVYTTLTAALLWGGVWGLLEATLGLILHLLGRIAPVPGVAGFLMFPIGMSCMMEARRLGGANAAVPLTAVAAALVKASSGLLPEVGWLFVANPCVAILAQGFAASLGATLAAERSPVASMLRGTLLAITWRMAFLGVLVILPVQRGILAKGVPAIAGFLVVDSVANGILIGLLAISPPIPARARAFLSRPALAPVAMVMGMIAQAITVS